MQPSPKRVLTAAVAVLCGWLVPACNSSSPVDVDSEGGKPDKLFVSPVDIDFGSTESAASLTLTNTTSRPLAWSASETAGWLSLEATSGTVWGNSSRTIELSAHRGSLAAGSYRTNVTVSGDRGAGSDAVSVSVTVPSASQEPPDSGNTSVASLSVSPLQVDFGSTATTASVTLTNAGDASLSWTASEGKGWLSLGSSSGSVPGNSSRALALTVDRGSLTAGTYTGSLSIAAGTAGSAAVNVTMTIESSTPSPSSVVLAGRVVDQFGEFPLAGLRVQYAGETATTDDTGAFSLIGDPTSTLSVLRVS